MSSIEHAVETINQRATVTVDDFDSTCPATRTMPRRDWLDFLQRESKRTNITFYNRTDGSRLKKNKVFLKHFGNHDGTPYDGPLPEDHENKKRRMEMNFKEESILQGNPLSGRYRTPAKSKRGKALLPCNCKAYIKVTAVERSPDEVTVEYRWKHDNHVPGSAADMASAPISRDARLAIQQLVEKKMTWENIKPLLRQHTEESRTTTHQEENPILDKSMRLTYQSVYYQINKAMAKASQRDKQLPENPRE